MGNRLATGRNQRRNKGEEFSFLCFLREELAELYLVVMLAIYPLFMMNGYTDLVYRKWKLLLYASTLFIAGSIAVNLPLWIRRIRDRKKAVVSALDGLVFLYLVCVLISFGGAADREGAVYGVPTWYMGLVAQLLFVGSYFAVSRGYAGLPYLKYLASAAFLVICTILLLQRFGVDVLSLYAGQQEAVKLNFVTTMGQVTWSSSYISVFLIACMGVFYLERDKILKIFTGICLAAGFGAEAVLNCDSGVLAVACVLLLLLWISLTDGERLAAFLQLVIIALSSFAGIGLLERIFAGRMVPIDGIYLRVAQSGLLYLLLAAAAILYVLLYRHILPVRWGIKTVKTARIIYAGLGVLGLFLIALLFILHGKGYFAGSPTENYFRFTVWWGNSRGFIWRTGAAVFEDFNLWRKLFGCGPDGFTFYAYRLMGDAINEFWSNQIVPNVHNEWFNAVINYGLVGGIAYLGIFITAAGCFISSGLRLAKEKSTVLFGLGLAVVGYMAHNVLCYQQMVGTPFVFILLGLGEALLRQAPEERRQRHRQTSSLFLK